MVHLGFSFCLFLAFLLTVLDFLGKAFYNEVTISRRRSDHENEVETWLFCLLF